MGLFSSLKSLFASAEPAASKFDTEQYKGFAITPQPMSANGQYRVAALIEKGEGESLEQHQFIRSDTCASEADAAELALLKCKMFIDQMGEAIFD